MDIFLEQIAFFQLFLHGMPPSPPISANVEIQPVVA